jgi:hypothetical protein
VIIKGKPIPIGQTYREGFLAKSGKDSKMFNLLPIRKILGGA